jgi:2'-5' RNA ligase
MDDRNDRDDSWDDDELPDGRAWRRPAGMFILAPVDGAAGDVIHALQRRFDPKLAAAHRPHLTLTGSSGVGPIAPDTPLDRVREVVTAIAQNVPAVPLRFGAPTRFMQSNIVSLPLDPHGELRVLHDRLARSGLVFGPARFTFTPHVTLSFYLTLTRESARDLLAVRVSEPGLITRFLISATNDPFPPKILADIPLAV